MLATIDFQALLDEAQQQLMQGDTPQALQRVQHVLRFYPKAVAAWYLLGEAQLTSGHTAAARNSFQQVLHADPQHVGAMIGLGASYEHEGLIGQAITTFEQVLEVWADAGTVRQRLIGLYQQIDAAPTQLLSRAALAYLYLRANLLPLAIGELRVLSVTQPQRLDLQVALAEALWRTQQKDAAVGVCYAVLSRAPEALKPNIMLGHLLRANQEPYGDSLWRTAQALDPCMHTAQRLLDMHNELPDTPLLPAWQLDAQTNGLAAPLDDAADTAETLPDEIHAILRWLDQIDKPKASLASVGAPAARRAAPQQPSNRENGAVVIAGYVEQLRAEPHNNVLRLALARLSARIGHYELAFEQYAALLAHHVLVEQLIDDLHELLGERQVQHALRRVQALLTQAYVFQGRYREAINVSVLTG